MYASKLPQSRFYRGIRSAMGLSGAFNLFADRAANGVCNVELSEIEAVLESLSLCEVPVDDRPRCCKGESVGGSNNPLRRRIVGRVVIKRILRDRPGFGNDRAR
jgi:hypothetical protein